MRGDRPFISGLTWYLTTFTPHARGSTLSDQPRPLTVCVYPACAGIDPSREEASGATGSLPRMRGDRPSLGLGKLPNELFTPHARGSTIPPWPVSDRDGVYPACAGIDPPFMTYLSHSLGLPRMRGDRPAGAG